MKKVLIILLVLVLSLSFVSCNNAAPAAQAEQNGESTTAPQLEETPEETPAVQENESLDIARQGKVTGINVGIGYKLQDAISELGEPVTIDYYEGTSFVSYEIVDLMLDRIIEDTKSEAYISGIIVSEGYEIYGVRVGMTTSEIKDALGAPVKEGQEADGEGDLWKMDYDCGSYLLSFFAASEDSATLSAYLTKKE